MSARSRHWLGAVAWAPWGHSATCLQCAAMQQPRWVWVYRNRLHQTELQVIPGMPRYGHVTACLLNPPGADSEWKHTGYLSLRVWNQPTGSNYFSIDLSWIPIKIFLYTEYIHSVYIQMLLNISAQKLQICNLSSGYVDLSWLHLNARPRLMRNFKCYTQTDKIKS